MLVNLKEILKIAEQEKKAIGMFNATGFDSLQAIISAAEELNEPVIIAHAEVHNVYNDVSMVAPAMVAMASNAKVPVCVHFDHGVSLDMIYKALRLGFTSVMIDASSLPYEENLKVTKSVTEIAHSMGVSVEAELGRLIKSEAGSKESALVGKPEDFYTRPDQAKEFSEQTGIDALAIAFGTSHGFYTAQPKLDFDVIKNCAKETGLPLVMHGGSGVSAEGYKTAIENGIRKINYYSYMSKAGYLAAKKVIEDGSTNYLHDVAFSAMQAMKEDVKKAIKVFSMK
ncbi:MAG: class II fructose-bisphosphate aldolase [Clostridiales bacterium]|nr:class II fructose-bisphosphate aldolase [Clostridiales bacterium]